MSGIETESDNLSFWLSNMPLVVKVISSGGLNEEKSRYFGL